MTEAGPELDAEIAEKVTWIKGRLSWNVLNPDETSSAYRGDSRRDCEEFLECTLSRCPNSWLKEYHVGSWRFYPRYSTDIAAAWTVVEHLKQSRKMAFVLGASGCSNQISAWFNDGIWALGQQQNSVPTDTHLLGAASASSAPLAICLAALEAVELLRDGSRQSAGKAG